VEVQRWHPSTWTLDSKQELYVPADTSVLQLKSTLQKTMRLETPLELVTVQVAKARKYQLKDLSNIPLLAWDIADDAPVSGIPWHLMDGDLVLYKDASEQEKVPLETLQAEGKQRESHASGVGKSVPCTFMNPVL